MFGLFGKSGFDAEMEKLEKQAKVISAEMFAAMNNFDLQKQIGMHEALIENYEQKIKCCNSYGKFDQVKKLEAEKNKFQQLLG